MLIFQETHLRFLRRLSYCKSLSTDLTALPAEVSPGLPALCWYHNFFLWCGWSFHHNLRYSDNRFWNKHIFQILFPPAADGIPQFLSSPVEAPSQTSSEIFPCRPGVWLRKVLLSRHISHFYPLRISDNIPVSQIAVFSHHNQGQYHRRPLPAYDSARSQAWSHFPSSCAL